MQIGAYDVLFELGRGGMGTVYLGRIMFEGGIERLVAIKRGHPTLMRSPEVAERFLNEARLTAHVHHANVVGMHQIGSDEDGHYMVFDYVEGESLAGLCDRIPQPDRIPPAIAVRILLDALAGLHAAHETVDVAGKPLGILHRDVSAENLLVGCDGVTRLTDFGIAKSALSSVVTEAGIVHGKLVYLSPEYLRRDPMTRTLDVYAMGVTLWIALAGCLPWRDKIGPEVIQAIMTEGVPPLSSTGARVDEGLSSIVTRACERQASRRYQSARQMLDALDEYARSSGCVASHVDVAEYVDKIVGHGLRSRREKIKTRRKELGQPRGTPLALSDLQIAKTAPQKPTPTPAPAPSAAEPTEITVSVTDVVRQGSPTKARHWVVYGTVLVLGLALGYGVFAAQSGTAAPLPSRAAPRAPVEEFAGSAQRSRETVRPPVVAPVTQESDQVKVEVAPVEPPATPTPKKRANKSAISIKNPYR